MRRLYGTLLLILALAAGGCARGPKGARDWTAAVQVQGNTAVITVGAPGMRFGVDYHPHLNLDGGPEVMMYTDTYTFRDLKPGPHQVRVVLADPDHNPLAEKTLHFEVK